MYRLIKHIEEQIKNSEINFIEIFGNMKPKKIYKLFSNARYFGKQPFNDIFNILIQCVLKTGDKSLVFMDGKGITVEMWRYIGEFLTKIKDDESENYR